MAHVVLRRPAVTPTSSSAAPPAWDVGAALRTAGATIVEEVLIPGRVARHAHAAAGLPPALDAWLKAGPPLYTHQAKALAAAAAGDHVVIGTRTASGKTRVATAVAMMRLLDDPGARALCLYPTKALQADQHQKWREALKGLDLTVGVLSGDTPPGERVKILQRSRVILATPDIVHAWWMANLDTSALREALSSLAVVFLDEAHSYEGAFGSNVAMLLHRLRAVHRGQRRLQFVAASATIDDPAGHAGRLCGVPFTLVGGADDGAPAAPLRVVLCRLGPGPRTEGRVVAATMQACPGVVLAFKDSRQGVEQTLQGALHAFDLPPRNATGARGQVTREHQAKARLFPYRAGYEHEDRLEIEAMLRARALKGVIATSTLELGVDVGHVDTTLLLGAPAGVRSFWQRAGRAGRDAGAGVATCVVVDLWGDVDVPLQTWLGRPAEPSHLYLENEFVTRAHARCAAIEHEATSWPLGTAFDDLPGAAGLRAAIERERQTARGPTERPWGFSLRGIDDTSMELVELGQAEDEGARVGFIQHSQALREAYPGAAYRHLGKTWRVASWGADRIALRPTNDRLKTTADTDVVVTAGAAARTRVLRGGRVVEAPVTVTTTVRGFRVGDSLEVFGPGSRWRTSPLVRRFKTTAVVLAVDVPLNLAAAERLRHAWALHRGLREGDIDVGRVMGAPHWCVYDGAAGSLGLTSGLFDDLAVVARGALSRASAEGDDTALVDVLARFADAVAEVALPPSPRPSPVSSAPASIAPDMVVDDAPLILPVLRWSVRREPGFTLVVPPDGEALRFPWEGAALEDIQRRIAERLTPDGEDIDIEVDDPHALVLLGVAAGLGPVLSSAQVEIVDTRPLIDEPEAASPSITSRASAPATPAATDATGSVSTATPPESDEWQSGARELRRLTIWYGRDNADVARLRARLAETARAVEDAAWLDALQEEATRLRERRAGFDRLLREEGADTPAVDALALAILAEFPADGWLHDKLEHARVRTRSFRRRREAEYEPTRIRPGALDHMLQTQRPSSLWRVFVDESKDGRHVAVAVPDHVTLPPLAPDWHAVDRPEVDEIDEVVQRLVDAPVGIFGIKVAPGPVDAWVGGTLELVAWTLRLLPLDGPTRVEFVIEGHGKHRGEWDAAVVALLRDLAAADPTRAARLMVGVRLVGKGVDALLPYADAVAFSWGSPTRRSSDRLHAAGLLPCLEVSPPPLSAWDALTRDVVLPELVWSSLPSWAWRPREPSLAHRLWQRLARHCAEHPATWQRFLDLTLAHLDSKAVDIVSLGKQVEFLQGLGARATTLDARLELCLKVAALHSANHRGATADDAAIDALCARVFDEDARLVCMADLVRAVLATNRFDFDGATRQLERWRSERPALPGLNLHGRVWSSLGQHAAFRGDAAGAEACFVWALGAFEGLANPAARDAEARQTGTYRAIVAIDHGDARAHALPLVVAVCGDPTPERIEAMACDDDIADVYAHHLLLRFLVRFGTATERQAYLGQAARWATGASHPWPLIELQRFLLSWQVAGRIDDDAIDVLGRGIKACAGGGPTVRFIGHALHRLAVRAGCRDDRVASDIQLDALRAELPLAPWALVGEAVAIPDVPAALRFLAGALPFNFH